MKELIKINEDRCEVNKRRLVLDFDYYGKNYRFEHDHWDWNADAKNSYTLDGNEFKHEHDLVNPEDWPFYRVISAYKHNLQAMLIVEGGGKNPLFIDRRYEHNYSFDVYFEGKAYNIGDNDKRPIRSSEPI